MKKLPRTPLLAAWFAVALPSCFVSQARHDEVERKLGVANAAHLGQKLKAAQLEHDLASLQQELARARAELGRTEGELGKERETLAQARFDAEVVRSEREEAQNMSDQLRIELERIASHLRAYSDDKTELEAELESARNRLEALAADERASQERFKAARELTLALAKPIEAEQLRLAWVDGQIALQFPRETLFDDSGQTLTEQGKALLTTAGGVLSPLELFVYVEQPAGSSPEREQQVREVLLASGVPSERVPVRPLPRQTVPAEATVAQAETEASVDTGAVESAPKVDARAGALELRLGFPRAKG